MSKPKRTTLDTIIPKPRDDAQAPASATAPASPTMPAAAGDGRGIGQEPAREPSPRRRTFEQRHTKPTVYLSPPVHEQLRTLSFYERRSFNDFLKEGLDMVFRKHGLPSIAELEKDLEKEHA